MGLINTNFLKPRNFIVIGLIALAVHLIASPVYKMIDGTSNGNTPTS